MNIQDARRHPLYSHSVEALNRWIEARCLGGRKLPYFDGGVDAPSPDIGGVSGQRQLMATLLAITQGLPSET